MAPGTPRPRRRARSASGPGRSARPGSAHAARRTCRASRAAVPGRYRPTGFRRVSRLPLLCASERLLSVRQPGRAKRGHRRDAGAHGTQDPPGGADMRDAAGDPDTAVEHALAAAAADEARIGEVLDALRRGRLWLPLPDDGTPVTDGSAVTLPTVIYLGREFVPAYTSADQLIRASAPAGAAGPASCAPGVAGDGDAHFAHPAHPAHPATPGGPSAAARPVAPAGRTGLAGGQEPEDIPHLVVPAAALASLLPAGLGIALNPGAPCSVPVYPEGVAYLAAAQVPAARVAPDRSAAARRQGGRQGPGRPPPPGALTPPAGERTPGPPIRVGAPPSQPAVLLARIRAGLA